MSLKEFLAFSFVMTFLIGVMIQCAWMNVAAALGIFFGASLLLIFLSYVQ